MPISVIVTMAFALPRTSGMFERGRRLLRSNAQEVLAGAQDCVWYLRRVDVDETDPDADPTFDERALAKLMSYVGKPATLGRPGDRFPPLGFARVYVPDNKWQAVIDKYLDRARVALLCQIH